MTIRGHQQLLGPRAPSPDLVSITVAHVEQPKILATLRKAAAAIASLIPERQAALPTR